MASTKICEFSIDGMHCDACELFIEKAVSKQTGVHKVSANTRSQKVVVTIDEATDPEELKRNISLQIEKQGYRLVDEVIIKESNMKMKIFSALLAVIIFSIFLGLQSFNLTALFNPKALTLPAIFVLGILASLSTCMAVVGGVAMTLSSKFAVDKQNRATVIFHISRFVGFIVLGGVVGLLGKIIVVNAVTSGVIRIVVALVMISVGADLVGIRLPRFVMPKILSEVFGFFDDKDGWTNAIVLGIATFFLPCAFTQSMQLYAMSTGSFITGAFVMGAFALGTLPVLSLVSIGAASGASSLNKGIFGQTMGYLIVLFALLNIVGALGTFGIFPPIGF